MHMPPNIEKLLLGEISDAFIAKAADGRVINWNRGAQDVFGYTSDEAVGRMEEESGRLISKAT
jgi:PAS domain S-box-containing protein